MKKRSRFLQVPIEPFIVEPELKADEILEKMERISFQGRSLGVAHRVWQKMLADDVTIFMGMAGALSAGGLRMVVAHLIEHRYIDCLVSTGANLYHDLHETRGRHHYLGSARANDAALAEDRIDRVYDTYASEEEFCDNDVWIGDFVGHARVATLHVARVSQSPGRPSLGHHQGRRHPDGRLSGGRADLLPGDR